MANVLVDENSLSDIADAIRSKNGSQATYKPSQMAEAISAISGGGITPTGTINITQNGSVDVTDYASANVNVPSGDPYSINVNQPYFLTIGFLQHISSVNKLLWDLSASSTSITRLTVITTEGNIDAYRWVTGALTDAELQSGYHPIIVPPEATSMGITITGTCEAIIRRYTVVNDAITATVYDSGWMAITSETELTTEVNAGEAVCITFRRNSSNKAFSTGAGWSEYPNNIRIKFYK